jgi:hypothetical protein
MLLPQFLNLSSFAEYMLIHEHACVSIRKDMPLDRAALIGVERVVLDDGWFGQRDDDTSSLAASLPTAARTHSRRSSCVG